MNISKQKIEILMAQKGLNRADIADKCGCSVQWVSTVINKHSCLPTTAVRLAAALEADVADIAADGKGA